MYVQILQLTETENTFLAARDEQIKELKQFSTDFKVSAYSSYRKHEVVLFFSRACCSAERLIF